MKILIVDDEIIERQGLQAILQRGFPDVSIAQAKNGRVAIELVEQSPPNLILMDIQMPGMNGLETIQVIRANYPHIKYVMVTAYDQFDYAKQAIQLGVADYILKPSKASEIVATVGKVIKQIEAEQLQLAETVAQKETLTKTMALIETDIVTQLLFDHVHEIHTEELVQLLGTTMTDEQFVIVIVIPQSYEHLYSAIKEKARESANCWVGALYGQQLPIIAFREARTSFRSQAVSLARALLQLLKPAQLEGWFIGIGSLVSSLTQLRQSYQEALMAAMDSTLPVKYRFYEDTPVLADTTYQVDKPFIDYVRLGQWDKVKTQLFDFIKRLEHSGTDLLIIQQRTLETLWLVSRLLAEAGIVSETPLFTFQAKDTRQLVTEAGRLLERLVQSHRDHHAQLQPDAMQQLKQYIFAHSHEQLSLDMIAEQVGMSPFYISKLFKEQLGVNYIDYLTECRIDHAKKLMQQVEYSLKEIAFEVGYHDPNYFSKVFKKSTNYSPKEYRNRLLGRTKDTGEEE